MSLDHAILGFLQYGPSTGYDLKAIFDLSVQHFWPADQSQIYRTLSRLTAQGFVEMERVEQEERPDRKVYRLTPAGVEELQRWLTTPLPMKGGRSAQLVQVFFAAQLSDEEMLAIFRRAAEQCRAELAQLRAIPAEAATYREALDSPRDYFCWMLTLECGMNMTAAHLAWLESVIARIEQGELPRRR
ncbi:MAG TPA: PadR family transcriptional regulator [Armatimonadota bacterium]|nr:PadR family transcriptional regulator [Armatimonadota bacterium]